MNSNSRKIKEMVCIQKFGYGTRRDFLDKPQFLVQIPQTRLKDNDLMNLLIEKNVSIAVEKGIIKSKTIIVDSAHTGSRSNPYSSVDVLKLHSKQLRKVIYDFDDKVKESLPEKNEDNDLGHELKYTRNLVDAVSSNAVLSNVPKIKERLNMLKEVSDDIEDHFHQYRHL